MVYSFLWISLFKWWTWNHYLIMVIYTSKYNCFFYRVYKLAGIILIPYIIWVTIAMYLNYTVYILNF